MNPRPFFLAILGGAALLLLLVFSYRPALSQSGAQLPTLMLCRVNVSPCQSELNLPEGGDAVLAMSITAPDFLEPSGAKALVGWFVRLLVESENPVDAPNFHLSSSPFQERGSPGLALNDLKPLSENASSRPTETEQYYRVRNRYGADSGSLEYSVTLLEVPADTAAKSFIPFQPGQSIRLGNLPLTALGPGTTRIVADTTSGTSPRIVTSTPETRLIEVPIATGQTLATLIVDPRAEKARLQGHIWSDLPTGENTFHPFTSAFRLEFWLPGSIPPWQGGSDSPVATYSSVQPSSAGAYHITDLHPQVLPSGNYDIRVHGLGALSVVKGSVEIDTSGKQQDALPNTIEVDFGPLPSGDTNGDNQVNAKDLSAFREDFGKLTRSLATGPHTDFNGDGVVDVQDFSLIAANFGRQGR